MSAGSEVSRNATITVTISSGKSTTQKKESTQNKPNTNNNTNPTPVTPPPTCNTCSVGRDIYNVFNNYSGFNEVRSALYGYFSSKCPGVKVSVVGVDDAGASGGYVGGIKPGDTLSTCGGTYTIQIAK